MNNEQLRDRLAESGKVLTANERKRLAEIQAQAQQAVLAEYASVEPAQTLKQELSGIDRILVKVPAVANLIGDVGNTLTVLTQSMIPASLPFLLIALIFAEAERVRYGVQLFETHGYLATIVAWILVLGNVFLELAIQYRHSGHEERQHRGSLRLLAQRAAYWLGLGSDWTPAERSPAWKLERLQAWLTAAILFLAIAGSMTGAIQSAQGNWREGLVSIARDSSLLEIITWVSGLVSAVVIVLLAQAIVAYSYVRAAEFYHQLLERAQESTANPDHLAWEAQRAQAISQATERAERDLLLAMVSKVEVKAADEKANPMLVPVSSLNGNGTHSQSNGYQPN